MPMPDQTRNLNPTPEARAAMYMWGAKYAASGGGSMDFFDKLSNHRQELCRQLVKDVFKAARKHNRTDL